MSRDKASNHFRAILARRLSRREALDGLKSAGVLAWIGLPAACATATTANPSSLRFAEIAHGVDERHHVAPGYSADILVRWGDPILPGAPAFVPGATTAASQQRQFGYNNDFVAYFPLPRGSQNSEHGLLAVNHEYTNTTHMWPGLTPDHVARMQRHVDADMAALGMSIVEIEKRAGKWRIVLGKANRRVTAMTPMRLSGPAAGHARLRTGADRSGTRVLGTFANCAGGKTPWGTVLSCEENFQSYFDGKTDGPEAANHARYEVGKSRAPWWAKAQARFDVAREPNEANRFGWVVELDPYDPAAVPVKRTALGRLHREGATCVVSKDGRVVIYSGDDAADQHIYKFVTAGKFNAANRAANRDLLDTGTLYAAQLREDGSLHWLPLMFGRAPLTPANGFQSQADVLIETRRAAELVGATKMDRPEDIETDPRSGGVYAMLTNNKERTLAGPGNPRAGNEFGHVLLMLPPGAPGSDVDHAALRFTWSVPILAGDPAKPGGARSHPQVSANGWFAAPDNCAFDPQGRLWIATDQGADWAKTGTADGLWACDTQGPAAYLTRMFFRCPIGAELCGPEFTPDGRTLFLAVQHPGTDGTKGDFDNPATRWPDFAAGTPPRPSIVAIVKNDGGEIGS